MIQSNVVVVYPHKSNDRYLKVDILPEQDTTYTLRSDGGTDVQIRNGIVRIALNKSSCAYLAEILTQMLLHKRNQTSEQDVAVSVESDAEHIKFIYDASLDYKK